MMCNWACLLGLLTNIDNYRGWPILRAENVLDGLIYCYAILVDHNKSEALWLAERLVLTGHHSCPLVREE